MWDLFSYPVVLLSAAIVIPWVWIVSNLLAAKLIGAPVQRAGLGIGPALLELSWGATACRLSWVPVGGALALEPRPERSQVLRRMLLVFAGPLGVLVVALLALFLLTWSDLPTAAPASVVGRVVPRSPAEVAGLRPGDRVLSVEGQPVTRWDELRSRVGARPGRSTVLTIERGTTLTVRVTPRTVPTPGGEPIGVIGIAQLESAKVPLAGGAGVALSRTVEQFVAVWSSMWGVLVGEQTETVGGPVVISTEEAARQMDALRYLLLTLLFVAPLCLLPVPPLLGGQLPVLCVDAVRGRPVGRRTRRVLMFIGVGVMLLVTLFGFSRDLLRFLA